MPQRSAFPDTRGGSADRAARNAANRGAAPRGAAARGADSGSTPPPGGPRSRPPLSPALRVRRAVALLVLALLLPGVSQTAAGHRRLGRAVTRTWLALLLGLLGSGLLALVDRSLLLAVLTRPVVLAVLAGVCFVLGVAWPLLIADSWRLARVASLPPRSRPWISALAVVLMVVTGYPLFALGSRALAAADLLSSVFGSARHSAAVDGRFNVLLMGGDAGPDRIGTRPDSMTVASIDAESGRTVLFSLPRNLENAPFRSGSPALAAWPHGYSCGDKCLLNGIYTWASEHRSLYPGVRDPGAEAMKDVAQGITGLRINYYVLIDLHGFRDLIDALGGITVTVGARVPIGGETSPISGYIEPGVRHLNGYKALWFARSRTGASDYARMARQRCVMHAMVDQLDPQTVLTRFNAIAAAGKDVVSTDIPGDQLGTFLDLAGDAKSQRIESVQFVPPLINPAYPDFDKIRQRVREAIDSAAGRGGDAAGSPAAPSSGARSGAGQPSGQAGSVAGGAVDPATGAGTDVRSACSAG